MQTYTNKVVDPIFIGGYQKSGTSLFRAMLGNHPSIAAGLESCWFNVDLSSIQTEEAAKRKYIEKSSVFFNINPNYVENAIQNATSQLQLLDMIMHAFLEQAGKQRWADKTPSNVIYLPPLVQQWPNAKIIHVVRSPADVCASHMKNGRVDTVEEFAANLGVFLTKSFAQLAETGAYDQYAFVKYEDLVLTPESVMSEVLTFLEEPWDARAAQHKGQSDDFEKVLSVTGKSSATLKSLSRPLFTDSINSWDKIITKSQRSAMFKELHRLGYGHYVTFIDQLSGFVPAQMLDNINDYLP